MTPRVSGVTCSSREIASTHPREEPARHPNGSPAIWMRLGRSGRGASFAFRHLHFPFPLQRDADQPFEDRREMTTGRLLVEDKMLTLANFAFQ